MAYKYTVIPQTVEDCDCEDCRAGRHLYALYRWKNEEWQWAGTSLLAYESPEQCKREHDWFITFGPEDTWEDGTPIQIPKQADQPPAGPDKGLVKLDTGALLRSAEQMFKHSPSKPTE